MKAKVSAFRFVVHTVGVVLLVLFGAGCQFFADPAQANRDRLIARLEEFSQVPPREQLTDQPYIKGRALVITRRPDYPLGMEDPVLWGSDKAKELMAESPEQVETVVVMNYSKEAAGSYQIVGASGGVSASREICEVVVIDRSIPAVIHRKTFRAPDPVASTSISHTQTEVVSSVDLTMVRTYVLNLPRR
jgi:hypothetical protein